MKLKELREINNYKQEYIASILGTSQVHYSRIERGKCKINSEYLIALSELYKVSTDYILGLKERK